MKINDMDSIIIVNIKSTYESYKNQCGVVNSNIGPRADRRTSTGSCTAECGCSTENRVADKCTANSSIASCSTASPSGTTFAKCYKSIASRIGRY